MARRRATRCAGAPIPACWNAWSWPAGTILPAPTRRSRNASWRSCEPPEAAVLPAGPAGRRGLPCPDLPDPAALPQGGHPALRPVPAVPVSAAAGLQRPALRPHRGLGGGGRGRARRVDPVRRRGLEFHLLGPAVLPLPAGSALFRLGAGGLFLPGRPGCGGGPGAPAAG